MKYIVPVIVIVFLAAVILYATMIFGWTPTPSVKLVGNTSVRGNVMFLESGSNGSVYMVSYDMGNMSLTSRILVMNPSCKATEILGGINGVVTGLVPLRYGDEDFVAVGLYRVEGSGTRGLVVIYDGAGNIIWELGRIELQNITITRISETDALVYAGIDPAGKVRIGKIYVRGSHVGEAWITTLDTNIPPGTQRVVLEYDYVTRTIAVGAGGSITILDESDGHVVFGPRRIGGFVDKVIEIPGKYIILVREGVTGRVLVLYKNGEGIWDYKGLYVDRNIVDLGIIYGEKTFIVIGEGFPMSAVVGGLGNYSGKIIVLNGEGSIIGGASLGDTVIGVRGGFQVGNNGVYTLTDYVAVNGSKTTFYTGLVSVKEGRVVWKHATLTPIKSFLVGNHVYLAELGKNASTMLCYVVTGLMG